jgi:hypothetical protein
MCYHEYSLEKEMLRTLTVLTIAGFAFMGAAQATPLKTESRQATVSDQANEQVAEAIVIQPRARAQTTEVRAPKPRIWISMGFGF